MSFTRNAFSEARGAFGISRSADSAPVNIAPPEIAADGMEVEGVTIIQVSAGIWNDTVTIAYQWFRNDVEVPGEVSADISNTVSGVYKLRETATNAGGSTSVFSNSITIISA